MFNKNLKNFNWEIFLLFGITCLAYFSLFYNPFINFDDNNFIVKNDWIQGFSVDHLKLIFTQQKEGHYQPITWLLYTGEFSLFKLNAQGYHAISLLLHMGNGLLVYYILKKLEVQKYTAFFAVFLFLIHPLQTEAIAWKSAQSTLLYSLFSLISIYLYLFNKQNQYKFLNYILVILFFVLACLSKSSAIVLPFILIGLAAIQQKNISFKSVLKQVPFFLILFLISFIFGLKAIQSSKEFGSLEANASGFTTFDRFFLIARACWFYIEKFIFPVGYSAIHYNPVKIDNLLPWYYYLYPVYLIGFLLAGYMLFFKKNKSEFMAGMYFYFVSIALVSQVLPIGNTIAAERYGYLTCIPLAYLAGIHFQRIYAYNKKVFWMLTLLIGLGLGYLTHQRIKVWNSNISLYLDMIEKYPDQFYAYYALGVSYNDLQEYNKALELLHAGNRLNNHSYQIKNALGLSYMGLQKYDSALVVLDEGIKINPGFVDLYMNRGFTYAQLRRNDLAKRDYTLAIGYNPKKYDAYKNRAMLRFSEMDYLGALQDLEKMNEIKPNQADVYFNLAKVYHKLNDGKKAEVYFNQCLQKAPDNIHYLNERGLFYNETLQYAKAANDFKKMTTLSPDIITGWLNLGISYRNMQDYQQALVAFEHAIKLNANMPEIYKERALVYQALKQEEGMIQDLKKYSSLQGQ